jgi:hypothetical protein
MTDDLPVGWYFKHLVAIDHVRQFRSSPQLFRSTAVTEATEAPVLVRREGSVAVMTLNNPRRRTHSVLRCANMWGGSSNSRQTQAVAQSC